MPDEVVPAAGAPEPPAAGSATPGAGPAPGGSTGVGVSPAPGGFTGLGVSPGRAAGPVMRMAGPPVLPAARPVADAGAEIAVVGKALEAVAADLRHRSAAARDRTSGGGTGGSGADGPGKTGGSGGDDAAEILDALAMMADDPMLREEAEQGVRDGLDAAHALDAAFNRHREALAALGGYLGERAADLDDLKHRAVADALGVPMPGLPSPGHPYVLVAEDLSPADTAGLGADVLALVTEKGGPTSHTAILARGRGLPAVVACAGITELPDGTYISVNGVSGEIAVGVTVAEAARILEEESRERARLAATSGPGRTADGHPVKLLLNIGSAADLRPGAEGVGLFRTEFLFLDRKQAPSFEEQVAAYAEVFRQAEQVVVRTLDAGTDKPLPFLGLPPEHNPALGIRGLRVDRLLPEVLDTQLDAIAEAARATGADAWVMAPMVTTRAEAADFARRARARGIGRVGVMVEVPAAALQADRLLAEVDFLSIGTNDLSQYTFAADRQHPGLADLLDPAQPALLRLVGACAQAGRAAGKPVGVCGEAAGDPVLAPVLAGLGVTSLSMAPVCVPAVRDALARLTLEECRERARTATA
ncbi:phosphoenolpyruvate--protein phosphotransferase [Nonomuraea glycinis]|uniref:phosphoenolpyruvate--protein phosphotransferase n=1 Tax=Nonomuraea glycinis TaxID=2047744 RepID=UPI002E12157A|nr:phosphoenolpyruvate--protein phosphotransferase [Nonomuraea glycinis]